jgi:fido (protein-threonine AMPylation protein)
MSSTAACSIRLGKLAGKSRRTDKNVGVSWFEIPVRLRQMLGDVRVRIEHQAYSPVEIAARSHHRLVAAVEFSDVSNHVD